MPEAPAPTHATLSLVGFEWYCGRTRYAVPNSGYLNSSPEEAPLAPFAPFVELLPADVAEGDIMRICG